MPANIRPLLVLTRVPGIGAQRMRALLDRFGDADAVFAAPPRELTGTAGIDRNLALAVAAFPRGAAGAEAARFADDQIAKLEQTGGRCLSVRDAEYPSGLKGIYDPPPLLFVKGTILPADSCSLAVVGTRRPSAYGIAMAERFAEGLGRLGITVVSGLARGIDTAAHLACVRRGTRTVAVIGSGIDVPYPPENRALEEGIASLGAVVSEYPMGTRPDAGNFPRRNRIISGISLGTIVIETAPDGGAMITARAALDQNREVFAVPSPVRSGPPSGTNRLIREGKALLVESVEDVIEELRPRLAGLLPPDSRLRHPGDPDLTLFERRVLDLLPGGDAPLHIDALAAKAGIPVSELLGLLLALECKGAVRQLPGKYFMATLAGIAAASLVIARACFS